MSLSDCGAEPRDIDAVRAKRELYLAGLCSKFLGGPYD